MKKDGIKIRTLYDEETGDGNWIYCKAYLSL